MDFSSVMKGEKKKKKSGGFQSMGLSQPVLKGILKKGYKVPTPIQRKTIPIIMEGKNIIAMARTGSGKTAAFLVPMLERLKGRILKAGARALIFSPTRELACQTMKFTRELGKHTGLKAVMVLGGERMEDQFAAMHDSPDIIIATPGRFLHLVIEMDLKLSSIEYVVFDEADRLFEMGFQEQLQEVLNRLAKQRQTLLFSATLPKVLADFVRSGIEDPVIIRLDVDVQISENLKAAFLHCRSDDKLVVLLYLLKNIINLKEELTVVFTATKHHVEYLKEVLQKADIPCSCVYSSLDQVARKINIAKFKTRQVSVLLVTDIAARGIDIPLLDNVVNYHFPANPKLYVHRVGRVARAGRSGKAFSIIAPDEMPFLLDLHLFLGKPVKFAKINASKDEELCGSVPQGIIDDESDILLSWHQDESELAVLLKRTKNAYQKYCRSRPLPSSESIKRVKDYPLSSLEVHPIFCETVELERSKFLSEMKLFRPNTTIFELGSLAKTEAGNIMRKKRLLHSQVIQSKLNKALQSSDAESKIQDSSSLETTFGDTIIKVTESEKKPKKRKKSTISDFKDTENYLTYKSSQHYKEKGLGVISSFEKDAASAVLNIGGDDEDTNRKIKNTVQWDRKRKKFFREGDDIHAKKMKTESGVWIPKSYKSDVYKNWMERNKIKYQEQNKDDSDPESQFGKRRQPMKGGRGRKGFQGNAGANKGRPYKNELKNKEEILKVRKRKARLESHVKRKQSQRSHNRSGKSQRRKNK